jgi:hypothetical protein
MDPLSRRRFLATTAAGFCVPPLAPPMLAALAGAEVGAGTEPLRIPDWVRGITRMSFLGPDAVPAVAKAGVQVVHGNAVWPYYPLRRDGGRLKPEEHDALRKFVDDTHRHGMKLVLGLPPFPSVATMQAHPEWRYSPTPDDASLKVVPEEGNLGTRLPCNLGPWGDFLIELCAELVEDYGVDGYSFDGNYHFPLCFCTACRGAYRAEKQRELPATANLDDIPYREYLVWRGEKLIDHYRRLQKRLKGLNPDAAIMTWTVNAGRYGHFLHSPRAMPTELNRVIDLPMQEWWLDETNLGMSLAPSFGAEYLACVSSYGPCGCEPYLMSRGTPYSADSFPAHERMIRSMLVLAHGSTTAHSVGWSNGVEGAAPVFAETKRREPWITGAKPLPWAGLLVSEQTRQFYAYKDIAERFLPPLLGTYRAAIEGHLPISLLNDWDLTAEHLASYRVVLLANAAALSDSQLEALREFVRRGGGLVATTESSLCDELGRPREDFGLADLFGVSYRGRPQATPERVAIDPNFAIALDETYWQQRVGAGTLTWERHPLVDDPRLRELVPANRSRFKGPQVLVTSPVAEDLAATLIPDGPGGAPVAEAGSPAIVARHAGAGRVVYLAAGIDAALWSYAYPYERMLLQRAMTWAAGGPPPIEVEAPRCVETTFYRRRAEDGSTQTVIHFLNNVHTTAGHGHPAQDVPLREESIPIAGMRVTFRSEAPARFHVEPGGVTPRVTRNGDITTVELPPLDIHFLLVGEHV